LHRRAPRRGGPGARLRVPRHEHQGRQGRRVGPARPDSGHGALVGDAPASGARRGRRAALRARGAIGDGVRLCRSVPEPPDQPPLLVARPPPEDDHGDVAPARGRQDLARDKSGDLPRPARRDRGPLDRCRHAAAESAQRPLRPSGAGPVHVPYRPGGGGGRDRPDERSEPLDHPLWSHPVEPGRAPDVRAPAPGARRTRRALRSHRCRQRPDLRRERRHDPGRAGGGRGARPPSRPRQPRRRPARDPQLDIGPRQAARRDPERRRRARGGLLRLLQQLRPRWARRRPQGIGVTTHSARVVLIPIEAQARRAVVLVLTLVAAATIAAAIIRPVVAMYLADRATTVGALERALAWDPRDPDLHLRLGRAYVSLAERPDYERARRHLESALGLRPTDAYSRMELASLFDRQGDRDHAREALDAALRADPHSVTIRWQAALLAFELGDREQALEHFRYVLAVDPSQQDA